MNLSAAYKDEQEFVKAIRNGIDAGWSDSTSDGFADDGADSQMESLTRIVKSVGRNTAAVGRVPQGPPTMRGKIGGLLVKLVKRSLFWYTPQIIAFNDLVASTFQECVRTLQALRREVG